jgi:hypothetical protein
MPRHQALAPPGAGLIRDSRERRADEGDEVGLERGVLARLKDDLSGLADDEPAGALYQDPPSGAL